VPRVVFECRGRAALEVVVDGPVRLLDVCDEVCAPIAFGCRSADCGLCRIEVVRGVHLVGPASTDEREVLTRLESAPRRRLACQVEVLPGDGELAVRPG